MATSVENFRSALHGFNRTDVVQFIQSQTMEHEKELRLLKEETARLQDALSAAYAEAEDAKAAKEALEAELAAAKEVAAAMEAAMTAVPAAAPAPESQVSLNDPIAPVGARLDFNEMELAAYRRAEMTERMARERATASAEQMRSIFAQATEKLNLSSQDLATIFDAFRDDFDRLRHLLSDTQNIVSESSASLHAASDICGEV